MNPSFFIREKNDGSYQTLKKYILIYIPIGRRTTKTKFVTRYQQCENLNETSRKDNITKDTNMDIGQHMQVTVMFLHFYFSLRMRYNSVMPINRWQRL